MHYKNGEEAKVGHVIKGRTYPTAPLLIGVVTSIIPGTATCNLYVAPLAQVSGADGAVVVVPVAHTGNMWSLTAGECERVA